MKWIKGKSGLALPVAVLLVTAVWLGAAQAEFYAGGYLGGTQVATENWKYSRFGTELRDVRYDPGVVGGVKFGYFFDQPWFNFPYLGVEAETNVTRNSVREQQVHIRLPGGGVTRGWLHVNKLYQWTLAMHFIGRYGFFPDKEVPFGRLQPYVGVGPAFVVVYANDDSAKNFALSVLGGVRYMMLKNVSAFVEFKYTQQWDIELEATPYYTLAGVERRGVAKMDFTSFKGVVGVAYHF